MTKFSEYIKKDLPKENPLDDIKSAEINDAINRYSGYSNDELMAEFIKQTNAQKQAGNYDSKKMENVKNTLMPYLNAEQQKRLNEIMKMVE